MLRKSHLCVSLKGVGGVTYRLIWWKHCRHWEAPVKSDKVGDFRMCLVNCDYHHHLFRDISVKVEHSGTKTYRWNGHSGLIVWGRMVLG